MYNALLDYCDMYYLNTTATKVAGVAELADALDLGSSFFGSEGSTPFTRMQ